MTDISFPMQYFVVHVSSHLLRPNARVSQEAVWLHTGVSPPVDAAQ